MAMRSNDDYCSRFEYITSTDENGKQQRYEITKNFLTYKSLLKRNFGQDRRNALLELFKNGLVVPVNTKGCLIIKKDPDIQKLLKKKKIEMFYEHNGSFWKPSIIKRTYLRIAK